MIKWYKKEYTDLKAGIIIVFFATLIIAAIVKPMISNASKDNAREKLYPYCHDLPKDTKQNCRKYPY